MLSFKNDQKQLFDLLKSTQFLNCNNNKIQKIYVWPLYGGFLIIIYILIIDDTKAGAVIGQKLPSRQ